MKQRLNPSLGFGFIILSGIFLVDPMLEFRDFLPDVVGYLLLCIGLRYLADLNDKIAQSLRGFGILLALSTVQALAGWVVHAYLPTVKDKLNVYELPVTILLCVFLVGVAKCCLLIPALHRLFLGLQTLAEFHGGVFALQEKHGKTVCERMARKSTVFVVLSSLFSLLPELAILTSIEVDSAGRSKYPSWFSGGDPSVSMDWYHYVNLFRFAAAVVLIAVGVVWLIGFFRCTVGFARDRSCMERLRNRYVVEILPQIGKLTLRKLKVGFVLITVGLFFTANFRESTVVVSEVMHSKGTLTSTTELLPGAVFGILTLFAVLWMGDLIKQKLPILVSCVTLILASSCQIFMNRTYMDRFFPMDALYREDAYWAFLGLRGIEIFEAAVTLLTVGCLLHVLWQIICEHTGMIDPKKKGAELSSNANHGLHHELKKQLLVCFVFFAAVSVAQILDAWLQLQVTWIWAVALVGSFFAIGRLISLLKDISEEVGYRYSK